MKGLWIGPTFIKVTNNMHQYNVDGLRFPTSDEAEVVAKRIWKRYGGYRTITVDTVKPNGDVVGMFSRISATKTRKEAETLPEEQLEMF